MKLNSIDKCSWGLVLYCYIGDELLVKKSNEFFAGLRMSMQLMKVDGHFGEASLKADRNERITSLLFGALVVLSLAFLASAVWVHPSLQAINL